MPVEGTTSSQTSTTYTVCLDDPNEKQGNVGCQSILVAKVSTAFNEVPKIETAYVMQTVGDHQSRVHIHIEAPVKRSNLSDRIKGEGTIVKVPEGMRQIDVLKSLRNVSTVREPIFDVIPFGDALHSIARGRAWKNSYQVEDKLFRRPYVDYMGGDCVKTKIRVDEINVSRFLNECTRNGTAEDVVQALDHQKWAADELQKIEDEQKGLDQSHHWFKQQAD